MNGYNLIPSFSSVGLSDSSSLIIYDVRIDGFLVRRLRNHLKVNTSLEFMCLIQLLGQNHLI